MFACELLVRSGPHVLHEPLDANNVKQTLIVAKQAEQQSRASHRMSAAAHRLNILAAFFFPIITLTALLGLDVTRLARALGFELELGESSGMETVLLVAILVCGLGTGWILMKVINRPTPK